MAAQTYQMISYAGFLLAAVFLAISILLWVKFGIRKIIGDLSGQTAKRSIEQMRKQNEASGKRAFHPIPAAMGRGTRNDGAEDGTMPLLKTPEMSGEQTEILSGETEQLTEAVQETPFVMIQDIVLVHTEEQM